MLKETKIYEVWETERTHRISLSLHEIDQLRHALKNDIDYPNGDGLYHFLDNRLSQMRNKIIDKHFS